jgi:hypothetical protein
MNHKVNTLIFSAAGVKCLSYAGAIKELERHDLTADTKNFGGSDTGALVALMLALDYKSFEIENYLNQFFSADGVLSAKKKGEDQVLRFIKNLILKKSVDQVTGKSKWGPNVSFLEFSSKTDLDLRVCATSVGDRSAAVFSKEEYPNMPIAAAVRVSVGMPTLLKRFRFQGKEFSNGIVTAGCICPCGIFDGKKNCGNIICMKITRENECQNIFETDEKNSKTFKFSTASLLEAWIDSKMRSCVPQKAMGLNIAVPDIPFFKFAVPPAVKSMLVLVGERHAKDSITNIRLGAK